MRMARVVISVIGSVTISAWLCGSAWAEDVTATAERVVEGMRSAGKRIAARDTGSETRRMQQVVAEDLQALINLAQKMQQSEQSQSSREQQSPQESSSNNDAQPQTQESDSGQGGANRKADDSGVSSSEAQGNSRRLDEISGIRRRLLAEVWGHLPETLRHKLRNDLGEKTLPGYDDLVRRYFEALAEEAKPGSKTSEKKIE